MNDLFPKISNSPIYKDEIKRKQAMNYSASALVSQLNKESIQPIEAENETKNAFIKSTFWFNPVSFFQNRFNQVAETHFDDYQNYRNEIQQSIDNQIDLLVSEMWAEKKVDEEQYLEYYEILTKIE